MSDEFENALAWFDTAPARWLQSARQDATAMAEWIWGVIQGDFNDDPSVGQIATGTVISMIPLVDQLCDIRDIIANCRKIDKEPNESWHWIALGLTLIGLFPVLGSLAKGCGKVMFAAMRKAGHASGATPKAADLAAKAIAPLNAFLARPEVRKTLKALKIDNPYKYMAQQLRVLSARVNTSSLLKAFDEAKGAAASLLAPVQRWGSNGVAQQASALLSTLDGVRRRGYSGLGTAVKPLQDLLEQTARRLDVEADMLHRAHLDTVNPHSFARTTAEMEIEAFGKAKPAWVDKTKKVLFEARDEPPLPKDGWPSLQEGALKEQFKTFHGAINAIELPPGTKLYRVVAPNSGSNRDCWMSEAEFNKLTSKDDWRRNFAVWANWNSNGEYVVYTVPAGKPLKVWEGMAASQEMKNELGEVVYVLQGGARQIMVHPDHLIKGGLAKRQPTGWGYGNFGDEPQLVGVPVLTDNWIEKK